MALSRYFLGGYKKTRKPIRIVCFRNKRCSFLSTSERQDQYSLNQLVVCYYYYVRCCYCHYFNKGVYAYMEGARSLYIATVSYKRHRQNVRHYWQYCSCNVWLYILCWLYKAYNFLTVCLSVRQAIGSFF